MKAVSKRLYGISACSATVPAQLKKMRRFGGRQKSPQEVIRTLKEGLLVLNRYDNKEDKRRQKVRLFVCHVD